MRRTILVAVTLAGLVLVSLAVLDAWRSDSNRPCRLRADVVGGHHVDVRLDTAQVDNAELIAGVGDAEGMPRRAVVVALATAQQESSLRNLPYGDRDSLGLFQQRPSQGWGAPEQILDPVYASRKFYEGLAEVPGWEAMPLTDAAQTVQRSAYPNAYAQWEPMAEALTDAVTGEHPETLTCGATEGVADAAEPQERWPAEKMGADGLTSRTRRVRDELVARFAVPVGGYCAGGCRSSRDDDSDHHTGRALDVVLMDGDTTGPGTGRKVVDHLVAEADRLGIRYLIWDGRIWSSAESAEGWQPYRHPDRDTSAADNREHLHISVY